jgi:hypothetical protein
MKYDKYRYIYPPRPKNVISTSAIADYDNDRYLAQPKLNGSCALLFTDGKELVFGNRHKGTFASMKLNINELKNLHRGKGWMILVGEYMNKSKKDSLNKVWNQKFVVVDIICYNGIHLVGKNFGERYNILKDLYKTTQTQDGFLSKISDNIYIANAFEKDFVSQYETLVETDMYEGLVIKSKTIGLQPGFSELNNTGSMIKVRKPTKNYRY